MLSKLLFTCNAVLPIILLIVTGYFLKKINLFQGNFFTLLNKLSFRCCLPCLLFYNVYNVENIGQIADYGRIVAFAVVSILLFFVLGFFIAVFVSKTREQKGVLLQASFRSNYAIIGISLTLSLCSGMTDQTPVKIASILSSISIPLFNVLATIALTVFVQKNDRERNSIFKTTLVILKKIITNPLILGVMAGLAVLAIRSFIPENPDGEKVFLVKNNLPFLYRTIQSLATAASTIALIALGGNFEFSAVSKLKYQIIAGTLVRVVLCPALCLFAAYKFGFRQLEFPALIALYGTPIAVSSVPMAAEMGNDQELAGQLVVWTTISSAFTLFAIIFICVQIGIFTV